MSFTTILLAGFIASLPPAQATKDQFIFNNQSEPEFIDPQMATGVPDNNIVIQLFEGLMVRGADWVSLKPGLAESYTVSKDGLTYTFKIRADAKWSDGKPITSKDFEYSWLRAMQPKTMAQYAYWLTDNVVGAEAYKKSPSPETRSQVGITAPDDRTFVVKLTKPVPYFLQLTAESLCYVVRKDIVEKFGDKWTRPENIVSSGPYKLVEWKVGQKMLMERNPHHYDVKNLKISKIEALPIEDRQTAMNLFKAGKLDWSGHNGAPNPLVPTLRADPNFRVGQGFITYFYRFNVTHKPLNDKRVRQALSLAIDRKQIVASVTRGGELPAHFLVPPKTGTYNSPNNFISDNQAENVKRAKALLAEAGYPDGKGFPSLNLLYNTDDNHKRIAQAIQQMWKKELGITVQPFNNEWKVYLKTQSNLEYDISRSAWQGDYPDPSTFLELFTSTSDNNLTGWKNLEYDKLFQSSNAAISPAKRMEILNAAEKLLVEEAAITPIYFYTNYGFLRPEVEGFVLNAVDRPMIRYYGKK